MSDSALRSIDAKIAILQAMRQGAERIGAIDLATRWIMDAEGKVVVSGIGKSGHIARKIVATLISTGQPAQFLHPAEAAHGDMGLISPMDDVILLLSNSGETDELGAIIAFARRNFCKTIIITGRPDGRISQTAELIIAYPQMAEGCPVDRAPMASTIAQLAIGDAIAAELMARRGFSAEDFGRFHHGGYLGRAQADEAA